MIDLYVVVLANGRVDELSCWRSWSFQNKKRNGDRTYLSAPAAQPRAAIDRAGTDTEASLPRYQVPAHVVQWTLPSIRILPYREELSCA
jgi:hypothetical protein